MIILPIVIITGKVVAVLHFTDFAKQVEYIQKIFFITGVAMLIQLCFGHRLPLVIGPSMILLIGIAASRGSDFNSIYSAILFGGIFLTLLAVTGMLSRLNKIFTQKVVATILLMVAFTITPTILNLIVKPYHLAFVNFCFALIFLSLMFVVNRFLSGIWEATLILWATIIGSLVYLAISPPQTFPEVNIVSLPLTKPISIVFDPALVFSFVVCFFAVLINDIGSLQSVGPIINPDKMGARMTRGVIVTGISNILAGYMGVIGVVNYTLSPGVIVATKNASRYTLILAALILVVLSFLPIFLAIISLIPSVVVAVVLTYVMCSQISAGLSIVFEHGFKFEDGLTIALPIMLSILVSFMPKEALEFFPTVFLPILGNGFVVGVLAVLFMEQVVFRGKK